MESELHQLFKRRDDWHQRELRMLRALMVMHQARISARRHLHPAVAALEPKAKVEDWCLVPQSVPVNPIGKPNGHKWPRNKPLPIVPKIYNVDTQERERHLREQLQAAGVPFDESGRIIFDD